MISKHEKAEKKNVVSDTKVIRDNAENVINGRQIEGNLLNFKRHPKLCHGMIQCLDLPFGKTKNKEK